MNGNTKERVRFIGGTKLFYEGDKQNKIHLNICVQMDHRIDHCNMQEALYRVLEICPLLKSSLVQDGDDLYMESCDEPITVFSEKSSVAPGSKKAHRRVFTVNCQDNVVSLCGLHSFFDQHGLLGLLYSLLIQYCNIRFGGEHHIPNVPEPDGKPHPELVEDTALISLGQFKKSHGNRPAEGTLFAEEFSADENGRFSYSEITVPSAAFMGKCRELGATPSVFLFLISAKAVYDMHPNAEEKIVGMLPVDYRSALGVQSMVICSLGAFLSVNRRELEADAIRGAVVKCRRNLDTQRTTDYAKTAMDEMQKMGAQTGSPFTLMSSYIGKLDLGDCAGHIKGFDMFNHTEKGITLFEMGDLFHIQILFGKGTAAYTGYICQMLNDMGMGAVISQKPMLIPEESG